MLVPFLTVEILTRSLKAGALSSIELLEKDSQTLTLETDDSDCFNAPIDISTDLKEIVGDVIEFNKQSKSGTVVFIEGQNILTKKFSLVSNSSIARAIDSMKSNRCKLFCHEEYILSPDGSKNVIRLQAVKIELL